MPTLRVNGPSGLGPMLTRKPDNTFVCCFFRIQGIGRVRRMFAQLDPMKQIVNELKKDRDSSMKKIAGIEKDISGLIQKFKVSKKHEQKH